MVIAPFDDLEENLLVDLENDALGDCRQDGTSKGLTLGIGIASVMACSPISSIIFLMRIERSATSRAMMVIQLDTNMK